MAENCKSCLREILSELRQTLDVDYRDGAGNLLCRLVFPEYFEESVENTPARIIMRQMHGCGHLYRYCFEETRFQVGEYDKLFPHVVVQELPGLVTRLVNLLDNAFRHSGDGTVVTLSVGVEDGNLKFVVADDGKGLPQDKINQIFDNFFTTAYEKGDRQRGVGLGLTICKAIVEAQGGTIQAYNSSQGGAVFEIRMPLEDKKDE